MSYNINEIKDINDKIRDGKKLTKKEEAKLEEYENTHVDVEFNLIVGSCKEITDDDKTKIKRACVNAVKTLGYSEIDMC